MSGSKFNWQKYAEKRLNRLLAIAEKLPQLKKKAQSKTPWVATVSLVRKPKMVELNLRYRKKKKPTDVLSFVSPVVFRSQGHLGEIIICQTVMREQAIRWKHPLKLELELLIAHGLLHLVGFDHEKSLAENKVMLALEKKLLKKSLNSKSFKSLIERQS